MQPVIAIASFNHDGKNIARNQKFNVSPRVAQQLVENKLVRIVQPVPQKPAGEKSPALPAGQASRRKTVKKSKRGETQEAASEPSLSQTPLLY